MVISKVSNLAATLCRYLIRWLARLGPMTMGSHIEISIAVIRLAGSVFRPSSLYLLVEVGSDQIAHRSETTVLG